MPTECSQINLQHIVVCSDQLEMVSVIIHYIAVSTAAFRDNNDVIYMWK